MANQNPFIDIQNVTKSFGAQVLFDDISFSIAEGQRVGLIAKMVQERAHCFLLFRVAKDVIVEISFLEKVYVLASCFRHHILILMILSLMHVLIIRVKVIRY